MPENLAEIRPLDWRLKLKLRVREFFRTLDPRDYSSFEEDEKDKVNQLAEIINAEAAKHPDLPPEIVKAVDPVPAILMTLFKIGGGMLGGMVLSSLVGPLLSPTSYAANRVMSPYRLSPDAVFRLWWKLYKGEDAPEDISPEVVQELLGNLRDMGWSPERIEQGKEASKVMPSPQDIIAFLAHEVFEPDMVEKYGLLGEWESIDKEPAKRIGLDEETLKLYWINHWQHASFNQIVELRRREHITDKDVWEWFRLVEIPPFWRPLLMELMWEVPTRVDVRRMWDMGTIDETRLRYLYGAMGYKGQSLEDYVLWTKVYVALPDLIARYKNGWLAEEDVKSELLALGLTEERMLEIWETKVKKPNQEGRVEETKKLTRALIIKGAKKGYLSKSQTIDRLMEINYAEREADYIYLVEVQEAESPETPLEFKALTDAYRRAVGMGVHETTEAAILAEQAYLEAVNRLRRAREAAAPQAEILTLEALVSETKARFDSALKASEELA